MNFNLNVYDRRNTTVDAIGMAILWCPSDPGSTGSSRTRIPIPTATISASPRDSVSPARGDELQQLRGLAGTWFNYQFGNVAPSSRTASSTLSA